MRRIDLKEPSGDDRTLGDEPIAGHKECRTADCNRARGPGAVAIRHDIGIALDDRDIVDIDAESFGNDPGVGGLMTLPIRHRADVNDRVAIVGYSNAGLLVDAESAGLDRV